MSPKKDVEFPQAHLYDIIAYLSARVHHVTHDESKKPLFAMISYLSRHLYQKTRGDDSRTSFGNNVQTASLPAIVYAEKHAPPMAKAPPKPPPRHQVARKRSVEPSGVGPPVVVTAQTASPPQIVCIDENISPSSSTITLAESSPNPPDRHGANSGSVKPSGVGPSPSLSQIIITAQTPSPPQIVYNDENISQPSSTITLAEAPPTPPDGQVARKRSAEPSGGGDGEPAVTPVPKKKLDQGNREIKKKKRPRKKSNTKDGVHNGSQRQPDSQVPDIDSEPLSDDKTLHDLTNLPPDKVN